MRRKRATVAVAVTMALGIAGIPPALLGSAEAAPVGQGFTVTPSDLAFILKQIKIAEAHVANTTSATGPVWGAGRHRPQPDRQPALSFGLRTVDGSCNNLRARPGDVRRRRPGVPAADHAGRSRPPRPCRPASARPDADQSYAQKKGNVFDSQPRIDQQPDRRPDLHQPGRGRGGRLPGQDPGQRGRGAVHHRSRPARRPAGRGGARGCTPSHETLFIPNVTTDVGLSPPYNSLFTLFGQFFDHGVDQTVKGGGTVFVPLKADDPLIAGPDHILGNARRPGPATCGSWC